MATETILREAPGTIPDRRYRDGQPHSLRSISGMALAAMPTDADDPRAVFRQGRKPRPERRARKRTRWAGPSSFDQRIPSVRSGA